MAALYLSESAADSQETFLVALRDVVEARKGMARTASEAKVNRENLYRSLSEEGNPRFSTFASVLATLGLGMKFEVVATETAPNNPSSGPVTVTQGTPATYTITAPTAGKQNTVAITSAAGWWGFYRTEPDDLRDLIKANTILHAATNAGKYREEYTA